jgi:hypothetical protein
MSSGIQYPKSSYGPPDLVLFEHHCVRAKEVLLALP